MDSKISVTHSLISTKSVRNLLNNYAINVTACDFLTRGLNDTYVVSSKKERYIFRIYRHNWRNKWDIQFELDAVNQLRKSGFLVSSPVKTRDGRMLVHIDAPEGIRYGVLFTYSHGERPIITEENCRIIGASLAELHNDTNSFISSYKRSFELDLNHLLVKPASLITSLLVKHLQPDQVEFFSKMVKDLEHTIKESQLEYGFCHGDFHNFNMHLNEHQLEVFDFDCSSIGYRAYDIAVFWWNLKNNYKHLEKSCWDEFLYGYKSKRTIPSEDLNSLPVFISIRRIWLLGTMLKNEDVWGTNWINSTNLDHFINDLKADCLLFEP